VKAWDASGLTLREFCEAAGLAESAFYFWRRELLRRSAERRDRRAAGERGPAEADASTRGNGGWRAILATLKDGSIEFEMVWDTADAGFTAIKDAFFNSTPIEFAALDGPVNVAGSQGLRATMAITNFSRNEPLEEAISVSITAKPTYSEHPPQWMTTT
jgi:hypothetical protein